MAIVVNALLFGAWAWSRGGQTTHVRVEARGNLAAVYADGRLQAGAQLSATAPGSIVLTLPDTRAIPSMPSPRGIDSIRVTDLKTGDVLFDDDFSLFPGRDWRVVSGRPYDDGGVIGSDGPATIALAPRQWGDVAVEATYRNVTSVSISVRAQPDLTGIVATVRPFHWNEDFSKWASVAVGPPGTTGPGTRIELSRAESVKALLASALHAYPYVALMLVLAVLLVLGLTFAFDDAQVRDWAASVPASAARYAIAATAVASFAVLLYFNVANRAHIPFVPDSITYIFQAKMLASGHLTAPPPPVSNAFDFFEQAPPIIVRDGRWIGQYPFGHPLMLAAGLRLHAIWLVPALLAAGSVALIGVTARNAWTGRTAVLASVLLATSPFFVMNATNYMSHNTAGFYLLASLAFVSVMGRRAGEPATRTEGPRYISDGATRTEDPRYISDRATPTDGPRGIPDEVTPVEGARYFGWGRREVAYAAAAGLFFGLLMNTRPLTAAALVVPLGAFLLWRLFGERTHWQLGARQLAAFAATAAVMLGLYLLYNYATTGDALRSGYQESGVSFFGGASPLGTGGDGGGIGAALGSGGQHDYAQGIQNERIQMALLLLVLNGWPQFVGLAFVLAPFVLGTRKAWDWFLIASALCVMAIWTLYQSTGVMYGPRYWYEAMPFLILLAARGADRAADVIAGWASWLRTRQVEVAKPEAIARAVTFGFAGLLVLASVWGWLMSQRTTWQADFVPDQASAMCCVLGMDDRIAQMVDEQGLHDALVLVDPCSNFVCYGSVFWRNNPTLDGDIVYARNLAPKRDELIAAYPGRSVYVANYNARTLRRYDPASAPRAPFPATPDAAATATPVASP